MIRINRFALSVAFTLLILSIGIASYSFRGAFSASVKASASGAKQSNDDGTIHVLAASYFSVKDNWAATLTLNNKGPKPIEVVPTLFSLSGARFEAQPVSVKGVSFRVVDLREIVAQAGSLFNEGSLQITYKGKDLELGAQVKLIDENRSLIFDEQLVEPAAMFASTRLEGVWWLPSRKSALRFVVSNTTDSVLPITVSVEGAAPKQKEPASLTLGPRETRVLEILRDLVGKNGGALKELGGISIQHSGAKGALLARALIQDSSKGHSSSVQFSDPAKAKSSKLHGAGLRLGRIAGENLNPVIVARNVGSESTVITGRVPYTNNDGKADAIDLPALRLAPGQIGVFNTAPISRRNRADLATAGLEFDYTTAPGSVLISALSVSRNGDQVFRVPMLDPAAQRSSTGGYPWFIEGDSSTVIYLKNTTDRTQWYNLSFDFEGGVYSLGLKTVEAGQTVTIDIRELRDKQLADADNQTIPGDAESGQIRWSSYGRENLVIIGRAEQADLMNGISSSYACQNCCPDSYEQSWLTPGSVTGPVGGISQFLPTQQNRSCYGTLLPPFTVPDVSWSSNNSAIVSISSIGEATCLAPGSVDVGAYWTASSWRNQLISGDEECINGDCCIEESEPAAPIAPVTVVSITLTATGIQEVGKSDHYISLINTGNVTITATLDPPGTDPSVIEWTGGSAGSDNLHRVISTSSASDTVVAATVVGEIDEVDTVKIHVVNATTPPPAAINAPKTFTLGGTATLTASQFGLTVVTIGQQGVTRPTFNIDPQFSSDRWVFRLRDVSHSYRLGVQPITFRIDLPNGNPPVFPLAPGMNLVQSHTQARSDLDTTGLTVTGPPRHFYWVQFITQNHEQAHVDHFYSAAFWLNHMGLFESSDVEATTVFVIFDCNDTTTTTGVAAVNRLTATWNTAITNRHNAADTAEAPTSESHAHGVSNPQYIPIRNAIPTP